MSEGSLFTQRSVPADALAVLSEFDRIISEAYPLNSKHRAQLPPAIRELSHTLTDERERRRLGYMNSTQTLSAYAHYFLWWNLVRLTKLFVNMDSAFFDLSDGDICLDLGSGPLTVVIALFLSRKDLRKKKLTWYCMDISQQALSMGENLFLAVAARLHEEPWSIVRLKGSVGMPVKGRAKLVTSANVFNEIMQNEQMPPDYLAKKHCEQLLSYAEPGDARILVVEPGVPYSARFVSLLRDALLRRGMEPVSPCTHCEACPMDGRRGGKWCNFVASTEDAPKALKRLSDAARLQKERAVLSFIAARTAAERQEEQKEDASLLTFRIASDSIRLPGKRQGFYACSARGLLLAVTETELKSGERYSITLDKKRELRTDAKSGALVLPLD